MTSNDELTQMSPRSTKPAWLRTKLPWGPEYERVREVVRALNLETVCEHARCPNIGHCWGEGTATFMVMGEHCTRGCGFCHVGKARSPLPLDVEEPSRLAQAVERLTLDYVVITSVDRDDLPDGGAAHLAACICAVRRRCASTRIEVLMPDLGTDRARIHEVARAGADVVAHNLETVARLTPAVRDRRAGYCTSLQVLAELGRVRPPLVVKSGLMLGLGETRDEVLGALRDLRDVGVDVVTLGQYLRPSPRHLPVERWVAPAELAAFEAEAKALGFSAVLAGPLVRSSFRARELFESAIATLRE